MKTIRIGGPGSRRIKDLGETAQYPGLCDHLLLWYNGSVQSKFPRETEYQLILECEIDEIDGLHYSKADHDKPAEVVRDRILELLDN